MTGGGSATHREQHESAINFWRNAPRLSDPVILTKRYCLTPEPGPFGNLAEHMPPAVMWANYFHDWLVKSGPEVLSASVPAEDGAGTTWVWAENPEHGDKMDVYGLTDLPRCFAVSAVVVARGESFIKFYYEITNEPGDRSFASGVMTFDRVEPESEDQR